MLKKRSINRIFISTMILFITIVLYSLNYCSKDVKTHKYDNYKTKHIESVYTINDDNYISKTNIYVTKELTSLEKVKNLLETIIIENNKNVLLPSYFNPIIPSNTKIISATWDNKIIKINFSKELLNITKEQSEKMIEAIVYTLTDIDDINGVEIYVENQLLKFIPHTNKNLPTVLTKDFGINKEYDIFKTKDVNRIILYFLGKEQSYIPITKYMNDSREKIEIIVESLSNKYTNNNLISLLDAKTKLISYSFVDNDLNLFFNDYIFEKDTKTMSKEIINQISYSTFANYDLDNINFFVNNEKIIQKNTKNIE